MYSSLRPGKYELSKPFGNLALTKYYAMDWVDSTGRILSLAETQVFYPAANSPGNENWLVRIDT